MDIVILEMFTFQILTGSIKCYFNYTFFHEITEIIYIFIMIIIICEGNWNVTVNVNGQLYSKEFLVAEYVLPKFQVNSKS